MAPISHAIECALEPCPRPPAALPLALPTDVLSPAAGRRVVEAPDADAEVDDPPEAVDDVAPVVVLVAPPTGGGVAPAGSAIGNIT